MSLWSLADRLRFRICGERLRSWTRSWLAEEKQSMSHRRWRQIVAPGVSPGINRQKRHQPSKRATEATAAPAGLRTVSVCRNPGLTPGAINMSPANAGWLFGSYLKSRKDRMIFLIGLGLMLMLSAVASSPRVFALHSNPQEGLEMPVQERGKIRAPELGGGRGWLNTDKPLSLAALKGKVVLLDFW